MDSYEQQLLAGWEDVFKKSQLTLWILLALKDGPKEMTDVKEFMRDSTNDLIQADDKSIYRALRRFVDNDLIFSKAIPNKAGPDKKEFALTDTGLKLLNIFVDRNIVSVFFKRDIRNLLES